jgi:hypothetical protein
MAVTPMTKNTRKREDRETAFDAGASTLIAG